MARTDFKPPIWLRALCAVGAALPALVLGLTWGGNAWWIDITLLGMCVLGAVAWIEASMAFMCFGSDELIYRSNFVRRRIPKSAIQQVTWEGGVLSVRLTEGRWHQLPSFGLDTQGLANSMRAWLDKERGDR